MSGSDADGVVAVAVAVVVVVVVAIAVDRCPTEWRPYNRIPENLEDENFDFNSFIFY